MNAKIFSNIFDLPSFDMKLFPATGSSLQVSENQHLNKCLIDNFLELFITSLAKNATKVPKWTLMYQTRRERLKSVLYLKLKKRKVSKTVKGGTLRAFLKIQFVAKYQKIEGGTLWRQKNFEYFFEIFEKNKNENFEQSHSAEILKREDPLGFLAL